MSEYNEHRAVCQYLRLQHPRVIFTSDGSGIRLPIGLAGKIKHLKSDRGIPDILIFEPKGAYHGLFIEMKKHDEKIYKKDGTLRKNEHLEEQAQILLRLTMKGYRAVFAIGRDAAMVEIDNYMKL